jgi:hypothetical protein
MGNNGQQWATMGTMGRIMGNNGHSPKTWQGIKRRAQAGAKSAGRRLVYMPYTCGCHPYPSYLGPMIRRAARLAWAVTIWHASRRQGSPRNLVWYMPNGRCCSETACSMRERTPFFSEFHCSSAAVNGSGGLQISLSCRTTDDRPPPNYATCIRCNHRHYLHSHAIHPLLFAWNRGRVHIFGIMPASALRINCLYFGRSGAVVPCDANLVMAQIYERLRATLRRHCG